MHRGSALRIFSRSLVTLGLLLTTLAPASVLAAPTLPPQVAQHVPVCPPGNPQGTARCHAEVRTDAAARSALPGPARTPPQPDVLGNGGAYDPAYLQSAYNLGSVAASNGAGRTVAIVDAYDDPTAEADLTYYRSWFGLPPCSSSTGCFKKVNEFGGPTYPTVNTGWAQEISLDLDMVSAICPKCNILLVEASSNSYTDLGTAVNYAPGVPGVVAISNSYGGSEWSGEASVDSYWNQPGLAVTVSAGDNGYGAEFPAASSYVTAVGGTTLNQLTNTGTRNASESVWSGTGSGCSAYESKPNWQRDGGCSMRTIGDVAAVADPNTGVWVYYNSGWWIFGGTSVASPIVASVYALGGTNKGTNNDPAAYPYQDANAAKDINDITSGNNGNCGSYLCAAGAGYDGPTGLGTPNGTGAFAPATTAQPSYTLSVSPTSQSVVAGNATTFNVLLTAVGGYNSLVNVTANGLPSGVTAAFNPSSAIPTTGGVTSALSITTTTGTGAGSYSFTVNGVGTDVNHTSQSATVTLTVTVPTPDFSLGIVGPTSLTVPRGQSGRVTLSIAPVNAYSGSVRLSTSGLQRGVTASFNPQSPLTLLGPTQDAVTFTASPSARVGTRTVTVTASGSSGSPSHSVAVTLTIQ